MKLRHKSANMLIDLKDKLSSLISFCAAATLILARDTALSFCVRREELERYAGVDGFGERGMEIMV